MNLSMKQKQIHRHRGELGGYRGGRWGGLEWEAGISSCKLLYTEWINNKVLLYSAGNIQSGLRTRPCCTALGTVFSVL